MRKSGNRHIAYIRPVDAFPTCQRLQGVLVLAPAELIASKVLSYHQRRGKPKSGTDWRDLALLLLTFPELKSDSGPVKDCLKSARASQPVLDLWRDLAAQEIVPESEDDDF